MKGDIINYYVVKTGENQDCASNLGLTVTIQESNFDLSIQDRDGLRSKGSEGCSHVGILKKDSLNRESDVRKFCVLEEVKESLEQVTEAQSGIRQG